MSNVKTNWPSKADTEKIKTRDKVCIYCGKEMFDRGENAPATDWATIEHLNHRKDWDSVGSYTKEGKDVTEIVGMCCQSCNSSRSDLPLKEWFEREYCIEKNINERTVATVVKFYIKKYEN